MENQELVISEEVKQYIDQHQLLVPLINELPNIVSDVFGKNEITLSIFNDFEESWSNLLISIKSEHDIDTILNMEDDIIDIVIMTCIYWH